MPFQFVLPKTKKTIVFDLLTVGQYSSLLAMTKNITDTFEKSKAFVYEAITEVDGKTKANGLSIAELSTWPLMDFNALDDETGRVARQEDLNASKQVHPSQTALDIKTALIAFDNTWLETKKATEALISKLEAANASDFLGAKSTP